MSPRHRPLLITFVLLAAACVALLTTVDVTLNDQPGVRMTLPEQLGPWTGRLLRYCHTATCDKELLPDDLSVDPTHCPVCGQPLHSMSKAEYDALPKDTEFVKMRYTNEAGGQVFVSIVLSGRERESIHRPERCLRGQGHDIRSSRVLEVPLPGGRATRVMVMENAKDFKTATGPMEYLSYYAYWFVGRGRETPYHLSRMFWLAWDRIIHSVAHKWAYISVSGRREKDSEAYKEQVKEVVGLLHDQIVIASPARPEAQADPPR